MVFARVASYLSGSDSTTPSVIDRPDGATQRWKEEASQADVDDLEASRPPYIHAMLAGGTGGMMGDMLMHSLDTVKTRQQGDPSFPPKYQNLTSSYFTIFRQEGIRRGLYSGWLPAFIGSYGGTVCFFGSYELSKRWMIDHGVAPTAAYFASGLLADLAASPLYVPSEVLKTRLQLQGRYRNPFFYSGYNYKNTYDAMRTIIRTEGARELLSGYKATLARDLPFSALQFALYERFQQAAKAWTNRRDIGISLEILTAVGAGGIAGVVTCPLDVVKTRIQTQIDPAIAQGAKPAGQTAKRSSSTHVETRNESRPRSHQPPASDTLKTTQRTATRHISTSGPSTSLKAHGQLTLDTESVLAGLRIVYKGEGIAGLFRGVGPRAVWTSIQSGTMLVMYQTLLKWLEAHPLVKTVDTP